MQNHWFVKDSTFLLNSYMLHTLPFYVISEILSVNYRRRLIIITASRKFTRFCIHDGLATGNGSNFIRNPHGILFKVSGIVDMVGIRSVQKVKKTIVIEFPLS